MRNALLELRQHPSRLVAVLLAIAISVGFVTACLVFTATETHAIGRSATARTSSSDVVIDLSQKPRIPVATAVAGVPGIAGLEPIYTGDTQFGSPQGAGQLTLDSLPTEPRLRWATLSTGRWPAARDELTVDKTTAKQYRLEPGSTITFAGDGRHPGPVMRVTGVTDQSRSLFSGLESSAFLPVSYFLGQPGAEVPFRYLVTVTPTASAPAVAEGIRRALPKDSTVQTSAEATRAALADLTHGADVFRYLLLVFGAIALLVGAIIITNTFTILIAQRRRRIGLLRAVGASTAQVRRGILGEALVLGLVGSAVGVALGVGIAAVASTVTGSIHQGLVVRPLGVLVAGLVGLVVTVLAASVPAARATRIAPLEALRPVVDEATTTRTSVRRRNASFLVMAIGAAIVIVAVTASSHNLVLAIGGSMVLAVGILLAAPAFLPAALGAVGRAADRTGPIARLAGANAVRNPGRAAATCTALMLGVGLIVTLQVGAASIKHTVNDTLDTQLPVDVSVTNRIGALSPDVIAGVRAVHGLKATTTVRTASVGVRGGMSGHQQLLVAGLAPDAGQVVAGGFERLGDSVVLAHHFTMEMLGVSPGERLTLLYDDHRVTLRVVASDIADSGTLVVTDRVLASLDPQAGVGAVWAAAADRDDAKNIMADVDKASGIQAGLTVTGSLEHAAALNKILDSLLEVATGLLGVAVLIALIGVGNTLGLSVVERTRESALLRALGLQRRELRLMLAIEAAMLALVGAVVGILAGALFGLIGTAAVVEQSHLDRLRFSMSLRQTLAVVVIAVLAGVLASVLPGRRAALASPTEALAEV